MKILGIDPGTVSFDLCLLDDDKVTFEDSIPSSVVAERPEELAEKCLSLKPGGYHCPLRLWAPQPPFQRTQPKGDV